MKKKNQYDGWELHSFDRATNFRTYQIEKIKKFIKNKKILDVGSGNGGLIKYYQRETQNISIFEPSKNLNLIIKKKFNKNKIMIFDKKKQITQKYDVILYMDVIEHIKNYENEIHTILKKINKNGFIIINVPAFNFLYTDFDKSVGHFKRFSKKDFYCLSKKFELEIKKLEYYDSIGFFLIFLSKFIFRFYLKSKDINKNVRIWNYLIPLSKKIDRIIFNRVGKSLICILQKN
tara:strand:- start:190 stop:888 length:699 start_codon:yes stop_codon:yes gene_type:complete